MLLNKGIIMLFTLSSICQRTLSYYFRLKSSQINFTRATYYKSYSITSARKTFSQEISDTETDAPKKILIPSLTAEFNSEFFPSIQSGDFQQIVNILNKYDLSSYKRSHELLNFAMNVCEKKEHLSIALKIYHELKKCPPEVLSDTTFNGLIRCYVDAEMIENAMKMIDEMIESNVQPRTRSFNPILDFTASSGLVDETFDILGKMKQYHVPIRGEQIVQLLTLFAKKRSLHNSSKFTKDINNFLLEISEEVFGLTNDQINYVVDMMNSNGENSAENLSNKHQTGVMVRSVDEMKVGFRPLLSILPKDSALSLNDTSNVTTLTTDVLNSFMGNQNLNDPTIPLGWHKYVLGNQSEYISFHPESEKYIVPLPTEAKKDHQNGMSIMVYDTLIHIEIPKIETPTKPIHSRNNNRPVIHSLSETSHNISEGNVYTPSYSINVCSYPDVHQASPSAQIVDITNHHPYCPHCQGKLQPVPLSKNEKLSLQKKLFERVAAKPRNNDLKHLQQFINFLRAREPYDFIIDAANIAYSNQNFIDGHFSYEQIEIVIEELLKINKCRILVIIPECYTKTKIPNSISRSREFTKTSPEHLDYLHKLRSMDMLYVVTGGHNDDWYWLLGTLDVNREKTPYVVTNDLMRDHRLTFIDHERVFLRWRNTKVIFYRMVGSALHGYIPTITFHEPGNFTREIQQSSSNGRWHIPALDRSKWLCLKIE